jgi:uncharacterized membrane protein YkvA (DUF1232 family)
MPAVTIIPDALAYLRDRAISPFRKVSAALAMVYLVWPLDLIPDVVPLIGWLDDLGILGAVAAFLIRDIRRHAEKRKQRAPLSVDAPTQEPGLPPSGRREKPQ